MVLLKSVQNKKQDTVCNSRQCWWVSFHEFCLIMWTSIISNQGIYMDMKKPNRRSSKICGKYENRIPYVESIISTNAVSNVATFPSKFNRQISRLFFCFMMFFWNISEACWEPGNISRSCAFIITLRNISIFKAFKVTKDVQGGFGFEKKNVLFIFAGLAASKILRNFSHPEWQNKNLNSQHINMYTLNQSWFNNNKWFGHTNPRNTNLQKIPEFAMPSRLP